MLDALAEWVSAPLYNAVYGEGQPKRTGRRHHAIAPYGTFTLADGSTVLVAVQSDAEWRSLAEHVIGDERFGTDDRFATAAARIANVDAVEEIVGTALRAVDADEARGRLARGRIATARVNDLRGVWEHEQLRARGRFDQVSTPSGPVEMLASPFAINDMPPSAARVPGLDEHDPELLDLVRERGAR